MTARHTVPVRRLAATAGLATLLVLGTPARALDVKLWPLVDYHRDASQQWLHLLGPLFSYERDAQHSAVALRPLFSYTHQLDAAASELAVLYPVFISRWQPAHWEYRLLGLISRQTQPDAETRPDEWSDRFTVFPFLFYRSSPARGTSLSVLPFYADLEDTFGYQRIQMVAFPLYLRLQESLIERTWLPFPFVSWSGGTLGQGVRVWPFYGWDQAGEAERFHYVMWPFYIEHERHFTRPEAERRLVMFPFYARIDSPTLRSRAYGMFVTHTIDATARTDTWGFPWPLWLSQRDVDSGERTSLRLTPFYEDAHIGSRHTHFILWPVYRWETQEVQDPEDYSYARDDAFLVLYRNVRETSATGGEHRLRTLFPLFRASADDGSSSFSTLAVVDALLPHNPMVQQLYSPLWQLYRRDQEGAAPPRWSLLWDLVSSDGTRIRYPIHLNLSE